MDYSYDVAQVRSVLKDRLSLILPPQEMNWLDARLSRFRDQQQASFFNLTFSMIPRFVGKGEVAQAPEEPAGLPPGMRIGEWSSPQLARTWWLLQLPVSDEQSYYNQIESLFSAAEMNEQVALYAALPLLAHGDRFALRASEGVRTSIGVVFDAIALDNPYPSVYMEEAPWNQLVLKAFFMDRPIHRIYGLDKRNNRSLAYILSDYAHERWAASRPVDPWLWKPVAPFLDERLLADIVRLGQSSAPGDQLAAALVLKDSTLPEARWFLESHPAIKLLAENGTISWDQLHRPGPR
jgi:hypothetical protein